MKKSLIENKANSVNETVAAPEGCSNSVALGRSLIGQVETGRHLATDSEVSGAQATSAKHATGAIPKVDRHTKGNIYKSKSSSSSARPRDQANNNFDQLFGPKNFMQFFTIKSNGEANLTKLNMFKVDKEITNHIGVCEKITEDFSLKSWTVEVRTLEQGNKLLTMTNLLGESVKVIPHEYHNSSQGVITCALLKDYTDEDIVEGLSDRGVIGCRRIIRGPKSSHPEPTTTLILTFNTPNPPDRLLIRTGLTERVRLYIPLPRRCFNCHRYGHSGAKCRKPIPVCVRCGGDMEGGHTPDTCQLPVNCVHCHEPHSVTSKNCKRFLLEKEILAIKTKEHLTFAEARSKVNLTLGATQTYSAVVSNPLTPSDRHQQSIDANNNDNATIHQEPQTSLKRPLPRSQSISPERYNAEDNSKSIKPPTKHPKHDQARFITDGSSHQMIIAEPHKKQLEKRNSLKENTNYSPQENYIMNTVRKSFKDRKKSTSQTADCSKSVGKR